MIRRFGLIIAATLAISSCSPPAGGPPGATPIAPTWPPATGTVVAESRYGRITSLLEGAYRIDLRETPLPPERSEAERAPAIAAIRLFVDAPDLSISYVGLERHPENSGIAVELYDSTDARFMVQIQTNIVLYMQPSITPMRAQSGDRLSPKELEDQATHFLATKNSCFAPRSAQLLFEPGNKGDNYFFRWHVPGPNTDRPWNQPTFVQISIDAHGTVFGYVDSGICYLPDE